MFLNTFAGTPPGVNVTSLTGLPLISTSRPPTWNEPMSRKAMGSAALAATDVKTVNTAARVTPKISDMITPLVPGILRRFPSRDSSEHAADGHADAGGVAFTEDIARHDLARGEHVGGRLAVLYQHARLLVHAGAEIGEGDSGPHRIGIIRRRLDPPRPVGLGRDQSLGAAIIEDGVIEGAGAHRHVEVGDGFFKRVGVEIEFSGELGNAVGPDWRKQRRHETVENSRVENNVGDLVGLCRDQAAPDGVALGPDI